MSPIQVGLGTVWRLFEVATATERAARYYMGNVPFWYCQAIGVDPRHQGRGFGGRLMRRTFDLADAAGVPCYLEAATEENVAIHAHAGYRVVGELDFPAGLHLWCMRRPISPC